jgi:hypothetical protein
MFALIDFFRVRGAYTQVCKHVSPSLPFLDFNWVPSCYPCNLSLMFRLQNQRKFFVKLVIYLKNLRGQIGR